MLNRICAMKLEYRQIPFLALTVIPIAFVSVLLTGGGHAPILLYIPLLLLLGPLFVLFYFAISWELFFYLVSPYVLYTLYGFAIVCLSKSYPNLCRLFVKAILFSHILIAFCVVVIKMSNFFK